MPTIKERLSGLTEPAFLLTNAAYHFFALFLPALLHPSTLSIPSLQSAAFSNFWLSYMVTRGNPPPDQPQQLVGSAALVPGVFASAAGNVLHVGPGSGTQVSHFATNPAVKKVYGAEPAVGLHDTLEAEIRMAGLEGKYVILPCPADAVKIRAEMAKRGAEFGQEGLFDSIVCVRVLCSVPQPEKVLKEMYALLRPGGRLIMLEHVANPWRLASGSLAARLMQRVYMLLGWSFFVGGCDLERDMEGMARRTGKWAEVEFERFFGWSCLSYVRGTLRKD